MRWPLLLLPVMALGCGNPSAGDDTTPTTGPGDSEGPLIDVQEVLTGQPPGQDVPVVATITDISGVSSAQLFYRATGTDFWTSAFLTPEGDIWTALIPGNYVQGEGVDYYVEATDNSFQRNSSVYPSDSPLKPLHFDVAVVSSPFPFVATFDPAEEDGSWDLVDTGWTSFVRGFDNDEGWLLDTQRSRSGGFAAFHGHGSPYQVDPFEDWLVSPPIDLSEATRADLYWWEWTDPVIYADHALYVSTTLPDPDSEAFELLADPLPATGDGGFARSLHVDLTPYAGQARVYLAFVYRGTWLDNWSIDDLTVEVPAPDPVVRRVSVEPAAVDPGGQSDVNIHFVNEGLVASGPMTATLRSDDSGISWAPSELAITSAPPGEETVAGPFVVKVDPTHTDNVFVPMELSLVTGEQTFILPARLQVGQPPVAHLQVSHTFQNDIQLYLGYGDPLNPDFYTVVQADGGTNESGIFTFDVDVSDHAAALPPDVEGHRWFVEVWDDSPGNVGTLDSFSLQVGDEVWSAEALPRAIPDDGSSLYVYLPGRGDFVFAAVDTDPDVMAPGGVGHLSVLAYNLSAPPLGPLVGTFTSEDPDVSGLPVGEVPFTYETLEGQVEGVFGQAFNTLPVPFNVAASHQDSSPVAITLHLSDGVDQWDLPLEVKVPWVVLGGLSVLVDDPDSATPNSLLDPGEDTYLKLRIRNAGDLATFGPLTATLRVVDDGGSGANLPGDPISLQGDGTGVATNGAILPGGGAKSGRVPITLTGGEVGTEIRLEVTLTDGTLTHTEEVVLMVGQVPWSPVAPVDDVSGDSCGSDLRRGEFKLVGTVLTQRWYTWDDFDPQADVMWIYISGAAAYQAAFVFAGGEALYYRWITNTNGSYWTYYYLAPETLEIKQIGAGVLEMSVDLADAYLGTTALFGGASSGPAGLFPCDYNPGAAATTGGLTRFWW